MCLMSFLFNFEAHRCFIAITDSIRAFSLCLVASILTIPLYSRIQDLSAHLKPAVGAVCPKFTASRTTEHHVI